jgi:hypothetical protein
MLVGLFTNGKNGPIKHMPMITNKTPRLTNAGLFFDKRCHASFHSELPCDVFNISSDTQAS